MQSSPERLDELTRYVREQVLATYQRQPGFKGAYLLVDCKGSKTLGITLFETEEALQATAATAQQMRAGAVEGGRASTPPVAEENEVAVQV